MHAMRPRQHGAAPRLGRLLLAGQALAALAFVIALLHAEGVHLPGASARATHVRVVLADAAGMPAGRTPVLVSGVPSGRVESVRAEGSHAVATLRLDGDARAALHADATATIEPASALEDMTIDLHPGSASAPPLAPGARIAQARTRGRVSADRVLDVLDADTRAQVAIVLDQLAVATDAAPGALRRAVLQLRPAVDGATRVTSALDRRRALLARLVDAVERIAATTDAHNRALGRAISTARRTLAVSSRQHAALRRSIGTLPSTLHALDGAVADTRRLATPLVPALDRLRPVAAAAPATLRALRRALPQTGGLVRDVGTLAREGRAPVKRARSVLTRLGPLATQLRAPTTRLASILRAINAKRDGIGELGENFSGVLSTNDANGPILRGLGFFEDVNPANFGFPGATGAKLRTVKAGIVSTLVQTCLHDNPLACLVRYLVPGLPGAIRR